MIEVKLYDGETWSTGSTKTIDYSSAAGGISVGTWNYVGNSTEIPGFEIGNGNWGGFDENPQVIGFGQLDSNGVDRSAILLGIVQGDILHFTDGVDEWEFECSSAGDELPLYISVRSDPPASQPLGIPSFSSLVTVTLNS